MTIYQYYAPYYDASGHVRFAVLMAQYLHELLERHPANGQQALDIACGTGTLALQLADQGWDVVGVDLSAPMLAAARAKAANLLTDGSLTFVQGDMRDLRGVGDAAFDLVTCTYDTLNYLLSEEELGGCFAAVARVLRPGGLLIADMNTRHFLEYDWGTCEVIAQSSFVEVQRSHFDQLTACSTMHLTGFSGNDQDGYQRFDELHIERAYAPEVIAQLLVAAGLTVEGCYDCFTFLPIEDRTQRIAWVARKN